MKIKSIAAVMICLGLTIVANPAHAANGFTVEAVRLRAGPDSAYPIVAHLPARARLDIYGCVEDYLWCDVSWGGIRGWMNGRYLETNFQNRDLYIIDAAPSIGVPILSFSINDYWGRYYHRRPFYRERARYNRIHNRYPVIIHRESRHDGRRNDHGRDHHDDGHGHWNR